MIDRLTTLFELQLLDDELDTLQELRGDLPIEVNNLNSQIQNIKDTVEAKEKEKEEDTLVSSSLVSAASSAATTSAVAATSATAASTVATASATAASAISVEASFLFVFFV